MPYLTAPPPELAAAIDKASKKYGVPADVLAGIWRIESGSTFPNPAVNSIGYGGLFGTKDWNGPTQDQADLAAKILADNIRSHGGSLSSALSAYSGGGYTSVPGEGGGTNAAVAGAYTAAGGGMGASRGSRPGKGGDFLSGITSAIGGIGGDISGAAGSVWDDTVGAVSSVTDFLKAIAWLFDPLNWLRMVETLFGFSLLLLGLYWLGGSATEGSNALGLEAPARSVARGAGKLGGPATRAAASLVK